MRLVKLPFAGLILLSLVLLVRPAAAEKPKADDKPSAKPATADPAKVDAGNADVEAKSSPAQSRTIRGRVVDLQGSPIAGVALHVPNLQQNRISQRDEDSPHAVQTKTDADGRFALEVEADRRLPLIAAHSGFAVELFDIPQEGEVSAAEIVLRPEQLIHGRIIDSEGRAVARARILVGMRLRSRQLNSLDQFLEELKKPPRGQPAETRFMSPGFMPKSYLATSDAEGRFVIRGIAADGACGVTITADGLVNETLVVVNRQGLDPAPYNHPADRIGRPRRVVGPDFTHVGVPGMTIEGRAVVDGEPAADVRVRASTDLTLGGVTTTDADGRYRLSGLPRGSEFRLSFGGPERQTDLLPHQVTVATTPDDVRKTVDVELKRPGLMLRGRVIDPLTGQGVPAFISFVPLAGNEYVDKPAYEGLRNRGQNVRADGNGKFRIPVIPGPGALLVQVNPTIEIGGKVFSPFRRAYVSKDDAAQLKFVEETGVGPGFPTAGGMAHIRLKNTAKYVNIAEDGKSPGVDIALERGKTIELDINDADGQPVAGAAISGIDDFPFATRLPKSRTTIYALSGESPRKIVVLHAARGLAGSLTLTGDEPSPVRMTLGKSAAIRGRAVDKSGEPLAEAGYDIYFEAALHLFQLETAGRPQTKTDKEGRFRFENVIPGQPFDLRMRLQDKLLSAKLTDEQQKLKPGQELDLADVVFAPLNQQLLLQDEPGKPAADAPHRTGAAKTAAPADGGTPTSGADVTFTFAGTVVDPDGMPVAGARVEVSYFRTNPLAPANVPAVLTDDRGMFEFSAKKSVFSDAAELFFAREALLIARKDGFGIAIAPAAWCETTGLLDAELSDQERNWMAERAGPKTDVLRLLRDDVPVGGRVLNVEGQPVAGATVEAVSLWEGKEATLDAWERTVADPRADANAGFRQLRPFVRGYTTIFVFLGVSRSTPPRRVIQQGTQFSGSRPPLIPVVRSDANGWFTLHGLGRERLVEILVSGPGIETTQQFVRSRRGEIVRVPFNRQSPQHITTIFYPAEFTLVCGPSVPIAGRVTDVKTGRPLAGVGVQSSGEWKGVITDAEGKYRLEGLPLGDNRLVITPPAGSRHLPGGVTVTTTAASPPVVRDVTLTAGVLVRGRAIDERTGKPVRGYLEYFAYETNAHREESDSLRRTSLRTAFQADADGRFEVPVLPGPGILAFGAGSEFPKGVGADRIDCPRYNAGGDSVVFKTVPTMCIASAHNFLVPVNPAADDSELAVDLDLHSGVDIPGLVLDPDGRLLGDFVVAGARRGVQWDRNAGESFTVRGYFPTEKRRLCVYHDGRNLAGFRDLTGNPPEKVEITLQPAATLTGRALNADGEPLENVEIFGNAPALRGAEGNLSDRDVGRGILLQRTATDAKGRFELKGIIPGLKYTVSARVPTKVGNQMLPQPVTLFSDVTAESGETKDLGDLKATRRSRDGQERRSARGGANSPEGG